MHESVNPSSQGSGRWRRPLSNWLLSGVDCQGGQHFVALDSLRGVCALLVVLYHQPNGSHLTSAPFIRGSYMFVDFFFVLSGFVIAYNYAQRLRNRHDAARFMLRRFFRLMPLYYFMILLYLALEFAMKPSGAPLGAGSGRTAEGLVRSVTLTNSIGDPLLSAWNTASWSISSEWWTYLAFATLILAPRFPAKLGMVMLATLGAAVCIAFKPTIRITADFGLLRCFFGFGFGALLAMSWNAVSAWLETFRPAEMTFVELILVASVVLVVSMTYRTAWSFTAPLLFLLCVAVFAMERGVVSRLLKTPLLVRAGMLSFSIYMVHQFVIGRERNAIDLLSRKWPGAIDMANPWHADIAVLIAVVAVWITSEITYHVVELPGQKLGKRVLAGRDKAPRREASS